MSRGSSAAGSKRGMLGESHVENQKGSHFKPMNATLRTRENISLQGSTQMACLAVHNREHNY